MILAPRERGGVSGGQRRAIFHKISLLKTFYRNNHNISHVTFPSFFFCFVVFFECLSVLGGVGSKTPQKGDTGFSSSTSTRKKTDLLVAFLDVPR
jgi:hypothetical protein